MTLRRVGDNQIVSSLYRVPAGSHPDYPAIDVLASILGDAPAGRLHRALVQTRAARATLGRRARLHDPGYMYFGAQLAEGRRRSTRRATRCSRRWRARQASRSRAEEVERARTALLNDFEQDAARHRRPGARALRVRRDRRLAAVLPATATGCARSRSPTCSAWPSTTSSPPTACSATSFRPTGPTAPRSRRRRTWQAALDGLQGRRQRAPGRGLRSVAAEHRVRALERRSSPTASSSRCCPSRRAAARVVAHAHAALGRREEPDEPRGGVRASPAAC